MTPEQVERTYKYIVFGWLEDKAKTSVWGCYNRLSHEKLGEVKWYGPWHQYCFMPTTKFGTVFNPGCMMDIIDFIEIQMAKRRQ